MALKALLLGLVAYASAATVLDFSNSNWIWNNHDESLAVGVRGDLRYDFSPAPGKVAAAAQILITGDDNYTLWVNGEYIGQGSGWPQGEQYCVKLNPGQNVFAAEVENEVANTPAALIGAIQITYTDLSTQTIVTDSTWRADNPTSGFQAPGYNDAGWPNAVVLGQADSAPWHTPALPPPASSLTLINSYWIWTNEETSPGGNAPVGHRAFRRTINLPGGVVARTGSIIIDTDNGYTLYINGNEIGQGSNWQQAQRWTFTLDFPTDDIVIAVDAVNTGGPAGLIALVELDVANCYCSSYSVYVTDNSWKYSLTIPADFQQPNYNDYGWANAIVEGPYGMQPWGAVPIVNTLRD
ncbi:hypothetical protein AX14_007925 [Amanita brunnescens Koide BX004]|nr:hypothetical protein AX14_007925 [Amanita brunnescens Koide BX004]